VPIEITVGVGGREIKAHGLGKCEHSADASIYGRPATVWTSRYGGGGSDGLQHLNLTVWQLGTGPAVEFTLALRVRPDMHEIATVQGGALKGRGTAEGKGLHQAAP
jgi:hypothetical protein